MRTKTVFLFTAQTTRLAVAILIAISLVVCPTSYPSAYAQQPCQNPPSQGKQFAWPPGASVTVNISATFTTQQQQAIETAFTNWANAGNSGVTFTFTSNSTPVSGANTFQVNSQTPTSCTCQAETGGTTSGGYRNSAFTNIDPAVTNLTALTQATSHEIGHTFGLGDCTTCPAGTSAMTLATGPNDTTSGRSGPSTCDGRVARQTGGYGTIAGGGGGAGEGEGCNISPQEIMSCRNSGGIWNAEYCSCEPASPIVIDIAGDGFRLTDVSSGVSFDINGNGIADSISWTAAGSDEAWLALDRNGNGVIDDGAELFGNFTPQPQSDSRNGFIALAEYDKPENGGNGDGRITPQDSIFTSLRLWQDSNHNGFSELSELNPLPALDVRRIDLDYRPSRRMDRYGNQFKYRAKVYDQRGASVGRWAWDVFLVTDLPIVQ